MPRAKVCEKTFCSSLHVFCRETVNHLFFHFSFLFSLYLVVDIQTPQLCRLLPDVGPCRGSVVKYYFDEPSKECRQFIYGGCKGNANNFDDEDSCIESCGGIKKKVDEEINVDVCSQQVTSGPCFAYVPRYFFNSTSNQCTEFVYGGCLGNGNNFKSMSECEETCLNK